MQLWGGGNQGLLSSFLTAAAVYLFCVVFVFVSFRFHPYKKFEELTPIYIFCYGHKNAGLESAFVRKLQYCSFSSFFFLFFISLGAKEKRKTNSVLFYYYYFLLFLFIRLGSRLNCTRHRKR